MRCGALAPTMRSSDPLEPRNAPRRAFARDGGARRAWRSPSPFLRLREDLRERLHFDVIEDAFGHVGVAADELPYFRERVRFDDDQAPRLVEERPGDLHLAGLRQRLEVRQMRRTHARPLRLRVRRIMPDDHE